MSSTTKNITFLLGSGISIKAGKPSTDDITQRIISDVYSPAQSDNLLDQKTANFIFQVRSEINPLYIDVFNREANYEEIYYAIVEIHNHISGERKNAVVAPLIEKISPTSPLDVLLPLRATHYIQKTIFDMLFPKAGSIEYLEWLCNAYRDKDISILDIFTTNHDSIIESCLEKVIITSDFLFTDGFRKYGHRNKDLYPLNKCIYEWSPELFEDQTYNRRLFKLHGCIEWYRWRENNSTNQTVGYVKFKEDATDDMVDMHIASLNYLPEILTGTLNKILEYTGDIYLSAHYHFWRSLYKADVLLVCGYGLSDRGINDHIVDVLFSPHSKEIKIIIVDPSGEAIMQKVEGGLKNVWETLRDKGQLKLLEKRAEEISWEELKSYI